MLYGKRLTVSVGLCDVLPFAVVEVSAERQDAKMGRGKFNEKWMENDLFKRWLGPAENNNNAMCKLCKKTFSLGTMGLKVTHERRKTPAVCGSS